MNDQEYQQTQDNLVLLAGFVYALDLEGFLERIRRAEAVGLIVDPTLYRAAGRKLEDVKRLAEAAQVFRDEVERQFIAKGAPHA